MKHTRKSHRPEKKKAHDQQYREIKKRIRDKAKKNKDQAP